MTISLRTLVASPDTVTATSGVGLPPRQIASPTARTRRFLRRARSTVGGMLPAALRPYIDEWRLRRSVPSAGRLAGCAADPDRVTVLGFLTAPTGLGEGARLCAETLADLGFTVGMVDATPLHRVPTGVPLPCGSAGLVAGDAGGPLICHLNPPAFQVTLRALRMSGARRKLIGYWAWELPSVPAEWRRAFRLVHEIWVPSQFVADALSDSGFKGPIRVVPHPLREPPPIAAPKVARTVPLTVLTVFAYESGFDRKNPLAAIEAFRMAYGNRTDVRLIIKVRGESVSGEPERRLAAAVRGASNIEIWDQVLTHHAMMDLLAGADIVLSLHRAEGFGIPLAEAMLMGKPVVATRWSGNLEFMDDQSACLVAATQVAAQDESSAYAGLTATWAEPSVQDASAWLRRLEDCGLRAAVGARGRDHARRRLGVAAFAETVAPAFDGDARRRCEAVPA